MDPPLFLRGPRQRSAGGDRGADPSDQCSGGRQACLGDDQLEAPVLDFSIPRRLKPSFGYVAYSQLLSGVIQVDGRQLPCFPAHSLAWPQAWPTC